MTRIYCLLLAATVFAGCSKNDTDITIPASEPADTLSFTPYLIKKGENFCDRNSYRQVSLSELKFSVRFDSSAIYETRDPQNQYDINKLYGFSDNNASHHQYSARFGWRWSDGGLRLFGYVYNEGVVRSIELKKVAIGQAINCELRVSAGSYYFTVDGHTDSLERKSLTPVAVGYQLYPYFGGDEPAPHDMRILIR